MEKIAIQQYSQNIKKGKEVIEYYINELAESGITHLPPWKPADTSSTISEVSAVDSTIDISIITEKQFIHRHFHHRQSTNSSARHDVDEEKDDDISLHRNCHLKSLEQAPGVPIGSSDSAFLSLSSASLIDSAVSPTSMGTPKLSAEYIRKHLGELSPAEESGLVQLRDMLASSHKNLNKMPKYSVMLRFLRAHADPEGEGNYKYIEKAHDMLCRSLAWRKLHGIDRLLEVYDPPQQLQTAQYWPCGWHGIDKSGHPVYILRLGRMDVKGILRSVGVASVIRHVIAAEEEGIRLTESQTVDTGKGVTTCVCVVDLEGLSMRHLWRPGVKFFLDLLDIVTLHYPESLSKVLIVRAPIIFPVIWALLAPFLDERTRAKFMIYAGNDCLGLQDFVNPESLPTSLGGNCSCEAACCQSPPSNSVQIIPKSHYQYSVLELERDGLPLSDDYRTVQLCAHYPHEVAVWVNQAGSSITWDFDSVRGDVQFTLFYVGNKDALKDPHHIHTACSQSHPCPGSTGTVQFLNPKAVESAVVEKIINCKDGDSCQGSFTADKCGAYVLQWIHRPAVAPASSSATQQPQIPQSQSLQTVSNSSSSHSDSLFASAMNSLAVATCGRVTLVYYADVIPMSANATDDASRISLTSKDPLENSELTEAACWKAAASIPSPANSSSDFAAFFTATSKNNSQSLSTAIIQNLTISENE